jgi:hypothetical protein
MMPAAALVYALFGADLRDAQTRARPRRAIRSELTSTRRTSDRSTGPRGTS